MAIGTTAAILGSAVIGAGASAIGASKNSKAINQATQAQTQSNAQSVALQRDIYGQNKATLSPYVNRGNVAGESINALLGLGGAPAQPQQMQPNALSQFGGQQLNNSNMAQIARAVFANEPRITGRAANAYGVGDLQSGYGTPAYGDAVGFGNGLPMSYGGAMGAAPMQATPANISPAQAAGNAFDIFRNSTGYQFRLGEGVDALNSLYAGAGMVQSGARDRAAIEYGQNFASNEFGNYMGYLGQQQGAGLSAAGAQAGVGLNYANNVTQLNQQQANNLSNAAVARANNSNALIGSIGGIGSNALGFFGGR